jgi:hypothetical protein
LAAQFGINVGVVAHALLICGFWFVAVRHIALSKNNAPIMGILECFQLHTFPT